MRLNVFIFSLLSIFTIAFVRCNKETSQSTLSVRLTDAPGDWGAVNIDLREVQIKLGKGPDKWVTLQTNQQIYDLLSLQNGIASVIAQGTFPRNAEIKEIRLILGPNNSVTVNGQTYPLIIPNGEEVRLKIKVDKHLASSLEDLLIDFDAKLSIKLEFDGYKLRAEIKLKK